MADGSIDVGRGNYVSMGIEQIILRLAAAFPANEVDASEVVVGDGVILNVRNYVAAVQHIDRALPPYPLRCPDALGVIGIGHPQPVNLGGKQLVEAVIGVGRAVGRGGLTQGVAVGAVEREII